MRSYKARNVRDKIWVSYRIGKAAASSGFIIQPVLVAVQGRERWRLLRVRRKSFEADVCAIARTLDVIGDWWSLLIIKDVLGGLRRFGELQRHLGAARNILTTRLKALVDQGILELAPASDGSPYNEYVPTEKGRALLPALVALAQWGGEYLFDENEECNVPIDSVHQEPLARLKLISKDGRELDTREVKIARDAA